MLPWPSTGFVIHKFVVVIEVRDLGEHAVRSVEVRSGVGSPLCCRGVGAGTSGGDGSFLDPEMNSLSSPGNREL